MLTAEQLALRQQGVSGSEAAALTGFSRWASPIDIYQSKIDPVATQRLADMESPLIRGILFEEPVIKWYSLITGRTVRFPGTLQHPKHPLLFATPDGIAANADGEVVLEVKNTTMFSRDHWGDAGTDQIDDCYIPQVLFEMACSGIPKLDMCVYMGVEPIIYHVDYDDGMFQMLREVCERFYRDHVVPRKPPPPDASESYGRYIERMYPRETKAMLQADDSLVRDMTELARVREKIETLQESELELKNRIKDRIADHAGIEGGGYKVVWSRCRDSMGVDYKKLVGDLELSHEQLMKYKIVTKKGVRRFLFNPTPTEQP